MSRRSQMTLREMVNGLRAGRKLVQDSTASDVDLLRVEILEFAGLVTVTPIPLTDKVEIRWKQHGNPAHTSDSEPRRLHPPFKDASN